MALSCFPSPILPLDSLKRCAPGVRAGEGWVRAIAPWASERLPGLGGTATVAECWVRLWRRAVPALVSGRRSGWRGIPRSVPLGRGVVEEGAVVRHVHVSYRMRRAGRLELKRHGLMAPSGRHLSRSSLPPRAGRRSTLPPSATPSLSHPPNRPRAIPVAPLPRLPARPPAGGANPAHAPCPPPGPSEASFAPSTPSASNTFSCTCPIMPNRLPDRSVPSSSASAFIPATA